MSQTYQGEVVSTKNKNTVAVKITFNLIHHKYKKPFKKTIKIQAHNENFELSEGDIVLIKNSKPYSATKRFLVVSKEVKFTSRNT